MMKIDVFNRKKQKKQGALGVIYLHNTFKNKLEALVPSVCTV